METFTSASLTDWGMGIGLGFLGMSLWNSYKAGQVSIPNPGAYIYLLKSSPIGTGLPLILGFIGYRYFGGSMAYVGGLGGGALGVMVAPMVAGSV
jgi:hypothetical protein